MIERCYKFSLISRNSILLCLLLLSTPAHSFSFNLLNLIRATPNIDSSNSGNNIIPTTNNKEVTSGLSDLSSLKNAQSYLLPLSGNQIRAGDYICTPTTSCEPCSIDNLNHPSCQPYGNRRALSCIPSPIQQILSTEIIPGSLPPPRHPGAPPGIGSNPGIVNSPVNGAIIPAAVVVGGALAVVPPIGNVAGGSGKPIPNVNGGGGIDWPVPKEGILGTNPLESGNGGNAGGGIGKIVGSNNNNNNALGEKGSHLVGGENGKIIADSASGKVPPEGETGATNEEVAFKESLRLEAIQDAETVSKDFGTSSSGRKVGNGALSSGGNGGSSNEGEEENELWSDDRKRMLWRRAEVGGTGGSSGAIDEVYTWEACPKVVSKERADFHEFVLTNTFFAVGALFLLTIRHRELASRQYSRLAASIGVLPR